jgi:hypothetical protein
MTRSDTVGVGLVDAQFITTIHAEALRSVPQAKVLAMDEIDMSRRRRRTRTTVNL